MRWTGAKPALVLTFADVQAAGERAARAGGKDNHLENMLGLVDDFKLLALFLVELADKAVLGFLKFLNKVNRPRDVAEHLPGFRHVRQGFYANYAPGKYEKYEGFERGRPAAWLLKSEQAGHAGKCI